MYPLEKKNSLSHFFHSGDRLILTSKNKLFPKYFFFFNFNARSKDALFDGAKKSKNYYGIKMERLFVRSKQNGYGKSTSSTQHLRGGFFFFFCEKYAALNS